MSKFRRSTPMPEFRTIRDVEDERLEALGWKRIVYAPRDGTAILIRGLTFIAEDPYEARAMWTARKCPEHVTEGWFPATDSHDGQGPYEDVTHFKMLEE